MANTLRLEQLFSRCDTSGSGLIDSDDFQDLCAGFGIEEVLVYGVWYLSLPLENCLTTRGNHENLFSGR